MACKEIVAPEFDEPLRIALELPGEDVLAVSQPVVPNAVAPAQQASTPPVRREGAGRWWPGR